MAKGRALDFVGTNDEDEDGSCTAAKKIITEEKGSKKETLVAICKNIHTHTNTHTQTHQLTHH